jgi:protein dithiol oxidoreductase (disulfide-forming)
MSIRTRSLLPLAGLLAVALAAPLCAQVQLVAGTDYRVLQHPQPQATPGKIEVIEFFSYGCPHCAAFYPVISAWAARLPKDVTFHKVPVSFNRPPWINLARAYYALKNTGDLERLEGKLFNAIHQEHQQLADASSLADWVGRNGGSAEKFAAAYAAFSVNNDTVQADKIAEDYAVDSIPTLAIGGKYVALADPNSTQEKYFQELLAHADALIELTRAASPMPAAAPSKSR